MSDHIYKKADNLWKKFSEETEGSFWSKYEKLIDKQKGNRQKDRVSVTLHAETTPPTPKTDIIFYPKRQELVKKLIDFRDRYQLSKMRGKLEKLPFIVWGLLMYSPILPHYLIAFMMISLVVMHSLNYLNSLECPQYIAIKKDSLVFHNFQKNFTPIIYISTIYSIKITYNAIFNVCRIQIETANQSEEFEYKLGEKTHQDFAQYFKDKSIPFDDRYY